MPIYEFLCSSCGDRFESLVPVGTASSECPACGDRDASRVLSSPAEQMGLVKSAREKRRMEDARGISRGGAKQRFKEGRRQAGKGRGSQARGGRG